MFDKNVIRFATAQEKRQAEQQLAFARLSGADARQKIPCGHDRGIAPERLAQRGNRQDASLRYRCLGGP
jgi:hypothetical protein